MADLKAMEQGATIVDEDHEDEVQVWVDSVASKTDDPSTPAFTIRTVLLGSFWGIIIAVLNTIFSFRQNPFYVPNAVILLLSYPMGVFMAKVLPSTNVFGVDLNPGPFSVKEHALIYIFAASAGGLPYGIDNVVTQKFKQFIGDETITFWNSLPWVLATQFIGYGIAGISRRYLVKPAAMMWPGVLPQVALLNSFHEQNTVTSTKYSMSRYTFFWLVFAAVFVYQWIPLYFATGLAMISVVCLFTNNRTLKFLGSSDAGAGIGGLTMDWSVVIQHQPLYTPFWAACNYFGGYFFWTWLIGPLFYYTNPFGVPGGYISQAIEQWGGNPENVTDDPFPLYNTPWIFDKNGHRAKPNAASGFLTPDYRLNETYYEEHRPFYLSAPFSIAYLCSFINIAAVFTHVFIWYGKDVRKQFGEALRQIENQDEDIYNVLLRKYSEVPDWFYLVFLAVFSVVQVLSGELTAFKMPWWSTLFGIALGSIYVIPIGIIQAISGFQMGLNVLTEFLIGLLTPGDTIGVMCFKSLGYNMVIQALNLSSDQKIGHYMHISPYFLFVSQMAGTFIGAVINLGTAIWIETGLASQLENDPAWNPVGYTVFMQAGGIWGAIGPARFFGPSSPYFILMLGFVVGLVLPLIPYAFNKIYPHPNWKLVNIPLMMQQNLTGQNQAVLIVPFFFNWLFNRYIFRKNREWWEKYNFILAIALDSATSITLTCTLFVQLLGPDFESVGVSPFSPAKPDFYCVEQFFNGTSSNGH